MTVNLASRAPQLFTDPGNPGYALAEDWNSRNAVITADAPAHGGDIVILFGTGLGAVTPVDRLRGTGATTPPPIVNPGGLRYPQRDSAAGHRRFCTPD